MTPVQAKLVVQCDSCGSNIDISNCIELVTHKIKNELRYSTTAYMCSLECVFHWVASALNYPTIDGRVTIR